MRIKGCNKINKLPRFNSHKKGRVFEYVDVILPSGVKVEGRFDVMWGTYAYFWTADPEGNFSDRNNSDLKFSAFKTKLPENFNGRTIDLR